MTDTPGPLPAGAGSSDRALTGIGDLDDILAGGLPRDRLYLIEGMPGTGKTTLALQFLLEGQRLGERGMYVTLSETADELRTSAASHGWSLDGISIVELVPEADLGAEQEQTLLHPAEFELGETIGRILERTEQERPVRLVLDSLSELRLLAQTPLRYRRQILALKHHFTSRHCTVLLLDDKTAEPRDLQLHSIVHGVVALEISSSRYGAERRTLRVAKVRGVRFRGGYHDYRIETGGLAVYPRLVAPEHRSRGIQAPVGTSVPELDALLGGGLVPGASTLVMGPTGTGKTSTATSCILATLKRGDRAAVFMFDEELDMFLVRAAGLGMNLQSYLDAGQLQLRQIEPAELTPGEFIHYVRHAVEIDDVRLVLIDSLNGYLHAMPNDEYLMLQMHELLRYLSQRSVLTLLILAQHGLAGEVHADVDLSYLCDTIILMRYFEAAGSVRRGLSVVKTRVSDHEPTIREFRLTPGGLVIGAVLHEFDGVLSGVPVYRGSRGALMATENAPPAEHPQAG
ncbi:ATPase domain-containing protein [Belnapia rosea]|uniref:ATPase domain-containing protein n=1 Tax=Belnapia rosea TaxID=938405 RepID=UPI0008825680|nr:ATPase domain-containing protein [Belnapia rosea]SDB73831.1 circadian clock protein KaiC [Belnapia rosea]